MKEILTDAHVLVTDIGPARIGYCWVNQRLYDVRNVHVFLNGVELRTAAYEVCIVGGKGSVFQLVLDNNAPGGFKTTLSGEPLYERVDNLQGLSVLIEGPPHADLTQLPWRTPEDVQRTIDALQEYRRRLVENQWNSHPTHGAAR